MNQPGTIGEPDTPFCRMTLSGEAILDTSAANEVAKELGFHHRCQTALCNTLESIADNLPSSVDNQQCLSVARRIFSTVRKAHEFEERTLFPLLEALPQPVDGLHDSLERLRFEHWEDESFAEEVSESLREYGAGGNRADGEKLAYMLRGFFEGLRRHMAFEAEHLLPLLQTGTATQRS